MLELLTAAVTGEGTEEAKGAAALRLRVRLQPAAGIGTRVMPPTYSGAVYLTEERRVEDAKVNCVLLDSQASQSNRLEEALLTSIADGRVVVPDVFVDQAEFGRHSALEFPHRVFDAFVEDALDGDIRFGDSALFGRLAGVINRGVAGPLVEHFPVGLLLGCWASRKHNPQGATRLARAITSEIVGYDMLPGERARSRLDLHHVSAETPLRAATASDARFEVLGVGAKGRDVKRPSEFGYGNVTPDAAAHGGVTLRFAEQQTIVSLAALRSVRTAEPGAGRPSSPAADAAARELLGLLALAMLEAQVELGWDLRSGCQLVPEHVPSVEMIGRYGQVVQSAPILGLGAVEALAARSDAAATEGVRWDEGSTELVASPPQLELLRRSLGLARHEAQEG